MSVTSFVNDPLPDQLIDECCAFALSVFVLLAEDELVHVRNQLDGLADDEQDGDRNLKERQTNASNVPGIVAFIQ
jgi:hypothetical protein